jgi:hypothetical protein
LLPGHSSLPRSHADQCRIRGTSNDRG